MTTPTMTEPTSTIRLPIWTSGLPRTDSETMSELAPLIIGIMIIVIPVAAGGVCSCVGGSAMVIWSTGTNGGAIRAGRFTSVVVTCASGRHVSFEQICSASRPTRVPPQHG